MENIQQNWLNSITEEIIFLIKRANEEYDELISNHESNEVVLSILRKFNLDDDEEMITECLGSKNHEKIREAEQGLY
jgi:hypothetical protein